MVVRTCTISSVTIDDGCCSDSMEHPHPRDILFVGASASSLMALKLQVGGDL